MLRLLPKVGLRTRTRNYPSRGPITHWDTNYVYLLCPGLLYLNRVSLLKLLKFLLDELQPASTTEFLNSCLSRPSGQSSSDPDCVNTTGTSASSRVETIVVTRTCTSAISTYTVSDYLCDSPYSNTQLPVGHVHVHVTVYVIAATNLQRKFKFRCTNQSGKFTSMCPLHHQPD